MDEANREVLVNIWWQLDHLSSFAVRGWSRFSWWDVAGLFPDLSDPCDFDNAKYMAKYGFAKILS